MLPTAARSPSATVPRRQHAGPLGGDRDRELEVRGRAIRPASRSPSRRCRRARPGRPAVVIGSIASTIPSCRRGPVPGSPKLGIWGSSCILRPTPWPTSVRTIASPSRLGARPGSRARRRRGGCRRRTARSPAKSERSVPSSSVLREHAGRADREACAPRRRPSRRASRRRRARSGRRARARRGPGSRARPSSWARRRSRPGSRGSP